MSKRLPESVPLEIPGMGSIAVTRTNADPGLCELCEAVPSLLKGLQGDYPDATGFHARCTPKELTKEADVTVTVEHGGEGGNEKLSPRTLFCWVAHAGSHGTGG